MKVLFIIYESIEQFTGGYLYDRKVISYLREKGDIIDILELKKPPYFLAPFSIFSRKFLRILSGYSPHDCVVIDELVCPSLFLPLTFRRSSDTRIVTLVHHLRSNEQIGTVSRHIARLFEKILLNHSDSIIVNSRTTRSTVEKLLHRERPISVCPPGKDTLQNRREPGDLDRAENATNYAQATVRILMVGSVIPRKGHRALIEALNYFKDLNWTLHIAGNNRILPAYTRKLQKLISTFSMSGRVHLSGVLNNDELLSLYRSSDLFVFPSEYEGFGIALAEALHFQLPYVAFSKSGALGEIVGKEEIPTEESIGRRRGGFLIDPENRADFRSALRMLIEDSHLRKKLSREASVLAKTLPSWRDTGNLFYKALHKELNTRPAGSAN
jgi:glycosyltransferase involved in cell wall biosynthesis